VYIEKVLDPVIGEQMNNQADCKAPNHKDLATYLLQFIKTLKSRETSMRLLLRDLVYDQQRRLIPAGDEACETVDPFFISISRYSLL
jgi:hypothetical protein